MSANAEAAVAFAQEEAKSLGSMHVEPDHLLLSVLGMEASGASRLLANMGLAADTLRNDFVVTCKQRASPTGGIQTSLTAREALARATRESNRLQATEVHTEHLLLGLIEDMGHAGKFLKSVGINLQGARFEAAKMRNADRVAKSEAAAAASVL